MKCDEMWWNVMKFNEASGDFCEQICHDLPCCSFCWALHPEARSFKLLPGLHNRLHLLYLRTTERYCIQWILLVYDLWWIMMNNLMNQRIMNLRLPLVNLFKQSFSRRMLWDSCCYSHLVRWYGQGQQADVSCRWMETIIRMATAGSSCLRLSCKRVTKGDTYCW